MNDFFGEVIYAYTRADALEDGVLVDVTELAKEAGFKCPVAVTRGVWADIENIPPRFQGLQDVTGRLWDILFMGRLAIRQYQGDGHVLLYRLIMHVGRKTYYDLKMVSGPGDNGELVITIMRPDED